MARRVNTKFIIIMTSVLVVLVGGAVLLALSVSKSYAEHVAEAEAAIVQAKASREAGDHEAAEQFYKSATQNFSSAFGEDPSKIELLDRIVDIKYERRCDSLTSATNIINEIVSILRQAYEHNAATKDNRLRYLETLTMFQREELVVDGNMGWYPMIRNTTAADVDVDPDDHLARRYLAIASVALFRPDLRDDERSEIRDHLDRALEHSPNDPALVNSLALLEYHEASRIRTAEGGLITRSAEQRFLASAQAVNRALALDNVKPAQQLQTLRIALSLPEQYFDASQIEPLALNLVEDVESQTGPEAGLTSAELFVFAQLIETLGNRIEQPELDHKPIETIKNVLDAKRDDAQSQMYAAQIKVLTGKHAEAIQTIRRGLQAVKPTNAEDYLLNYNSIRPLHKLEVQSHLALAEKAENPAERQAQLEKADTAIDAYRSVEGTANENTDAIAHYYEGQAAWIRGDTRETLRKLMLANRQFNNGHFNTLRLIGISHQQMNNLGKAAEFYELALNRSQNQEVHLRLIQTYLQLGAGRLPRINELTDAYIRTYPEDPRGAILRAQAIALSGNPKMAADLLSRLKPEENPQLVPLISQYLVQAGDRDAAKALLRQRLETEISDGNALQALLNLLESPEDRIAEIDRLEQAGLEADRAEQLRSFIRLSSSNDAASQAELIEKFGGDDFSTAMQMYRFYESRGESEKAEEALAEAESHNPNAPALLQVLFERSLREGNVKRSNELVDRMLALPPAQRPAVAGNEQMLRTMVEASQFAATGDGDAEKRRALIADYRQALKADPNMVDGWLQLAQLLIIDEKISEAREAAKQAYDLQPNNVRAIQLYTQALAFTNDMPTALRTLESAVASSPNNLVLRSLYVLLAERGGYLPIAITQREFIRDRQPDNYENRRALAQNYLRQDRPTAALAEVNRILEDQGPTREGIALKAQILLEQDQTSQAISVVENYINARGEDADAADYLLLSRLHMNSDSIEKATAAYEQARAKDESKNDEVTRAFATMLLQAGQAQQAVGLLKELSEASPNDHAVKTVLVQALMFSNELDQAQSRLEELPDSAQKQLIRYEILSRQDKPEQAMEILESAIKKYPEDTSVNFAYAQAKAQAGDIQTAAPVIRKLAETAGERNDVQLLLARLEATEGDRDSARRRLRTLIQNAPNYVQARETLFFLLNGDALTARATDPDRAAELNEQALAVIAPLADQLPENEAVNRLAGQSALQAGRSDRAVLFFERAYDQSPSTQNLALLSRALINADSAKQAIELLRKPDHATELNQNLELKVLWAQALAKSNQIEQAQNLFASLLNENTAREVQARLALAVCQTVTPEQAAAIFDAAFNNDPPVVVDAEHIRYLSQAQQWEKILSRYSDYETNLPTDPQLRQSIISQLALACQYSEEFERAKKLYEVLLEDNPKDMGTLNNLAYLLSDELEGYEDEAVAMAERAVAVMNENSSEYSDYTKSLVLDTLGWAQYRSGQLDLAIKTLDKSIGLSENYANRIHLAKAYNDKGDTNRAISLLIQARADAIRSDDQKQVKEINELIDELNQQQ